MALLNKGRLDGIYTQFDSAFNDMWNQLYGMADTWRGFTTETNSSSEQTDYKFLEELPKLEEWIGERRVAGASARSYVVVNKKWSSALSIKREHLEDDTLGIALQRINNLVAEVWRGVEEQVYTGLKDGITNLCLDGNAFFSNHGTPGDNYDSGGAANHWYLLDTKKMSYKPMILQWREQPRLDALTNPTSDHVWKYDEYLYGACCRFAAAYGFWQTAYASNQVLNGTNVEAAAETMMGFKDALGRPLGIVPDCIVVHPGNWAEAMRLYDADLISDGTNYVSNIHKGRWKVIVSEWLTD